jgi:hypothetical protein
VTRTRVIAGLLLLVAAAAVSFWVASDDEPQTLVEACRSLEAPQEGDGRLAAEAVDHAHVRLSWDGAGGCVFRDGLLVGAIPGSAFTDALLWPETEYRYAVVSADGDAAATADVRTRALPPAGFPRPFAADSFWNTPLPADAAPGPGSEATVRYLVAHAERPNLTLRAWGVSVAEVHEGDPRYHVPCTRYRCTLDAFGPVPIPLTAQPDPEADGHLAVYDHAAEREWGMWQARRAGDGWEASAGAAVSTAGDGLAPADVGAGNAANFPLLGGLIRPEEILQGRIEHALVVGVPGIGAGPPVCPATHNAATSDDPDAPREGTLLQLDPQVDVESLGVPVWVAVVARALQTYGVYVRDNSGSLSVYAENPVSRGYDAWSLAGLPAGGSVSLDGIPWDRFRVVASPGC